MDDRGREGNTWVYGEREREKKQKEKLREREKEGEKGLVV